MSIDTQSMPWTRPRRIAFRFLFAYGVLYLFPFPLWVLPKTEWLSDGVNAFWEAVVGWLGEHLFGVEFATSFNGSGDRLFDYAQAATLLALAAVVTAIWSIADKRTSYPRLRDGLRTWIRFFLGAMMISYGLAKVFKTQFPDPGIRRLTETYGESSPMGLLWAFMGKSAAYCAFTGAAEVVGGILLFWRRTTTLGALLIIGVMSNVVMLNFCYDVPVKLFSVHLLLASCWLLAPDVRRLFDVLVRNRATMPVVLEAPGEPMSPRRARLRRVARIVTIACIIGFTTYGEVDMLGARPDRFVALEGYYRVDRLVWNGHDSPPLLTDGARWRALVISPTGIVGLRTMQDEITYYSLDAKEGAPLTGPIDIDSYSDDTVLGQWTIARLDATHLRIHGALSHDQFDATVTRYPDTGASLLTSRGFHWVNEAPLNR
jgi:uncharacterized membrane protein YphA (DoxX/SURF4 family)